MIDPAWLTPPAASCRVALALLFGRAAWGKLRDLPGFTDMLRAYRLLPDRTVPTMAAALAAAELVLAGWLASGWTARGAGLLAGLLLMLFAGAMAINLRRGRADIACGCFAGTAGGSARLSWAGVAATLLLIPPALFASLQPDLVASPVILLQASLAGLLLFTLHDAATRLARIRP